MANRKIRFAAREIGRFTRFDQFERDPRGQSSCR
jgi:hypothetical protein